MQLTRKQLKQIISEEVEKISEEQDKLDTLLEGYVADYDSGNETVSKEALIDFLEVMEESTIPKEALEAFMHNLSEDTVTKILSEVVEKEE